MKRRVKAKTWWISHDNGEHIAYGKNAGEVWTSRENWETFDNEAEWTARLLELGVDIDAQEEQ